MLANRVLALLREDGIAAVGRRLRRWAWSDSKNIVFRRELTGQGEVLVWPDVAFRVAGESDLPFLVRGMPHLVGRAEALFLQQFGHGDLTLMGVPMDKPDELCFSAWLSHDDLGLRLLGDCVGQSDVSIRRVWVPPAYRRRGLAMRGMQFAEQEALRIGAVRIWSLVLTDNTASLRLHEKLGYERFGQIRLVMCLGRRTARTRRRDREGQDVQPLPRHISKL